MPVNIDLIWFFYCLFLIYSEPFKRKENETIYGRTNFYFVDLDGIGKNQCKRTAFEKIANSTKNVIILPKDCYVLGWDNVYDYKLSKNKAELIFYWKITDQPKLFYNKQ